MEREKLEIDGEVLFYLLNDSLDYADIDDDYREDIINLSSDFEVMQNKIVSHDEFDGGAYWEAVIQQKSTNRFFEINYSDWDMGREGGWAGTFEGSSLNNELFEVFPTVKTVIVYE